MERDTLKELVNVFVKALKVGQSCKYSMDGLTYEATMMRAHNGYVRVVVADSAGTREVLASNGGFHEDRMTSEERDRFVEEMEKLMNAPRPVIKLEVDVKDFGRMLVRRLSGRVVNYDHLGLSYHVICGNRGIPGNTCRLEVFRGGSLQDRVFICDGNGDYEISMTAEELIHFVGVMLEEI